MVVVPVRGGSEGDVCDVVFGASEECSVVGESVGVFRYVVAAPTVTLPVLEVKVKGHVRLSVLQLLMLAMLRYLDLLRYMAEVYGSTMYRFSTRSRMMLIAGVGWNVIWSMGILLNRCIW